MGYINIFLNSDAKINIKNSQLNFVSKDKSMDYPLEDVNCVMIDNPNTVVSFTTLAKLAEYGILTYVCDNKHLPNGAGSIRAPSTRCAICSRRTWMRLTTSSRRF